MSDDSRWRRYWRSVNARLRPGVDDELAFHVEMRTRELVGRGLDPETAAREAERRFGDRQRVRHQLERIERKRGYRLRLMFFFEELWQDVRYGIRGLRKRPGFTFAAASSLALGIGATTTVLSIVDPVLFRPLQVREADRLAVIGAETRNLPAVSPLISLPTIDDIGRLGIFTDVAGARMELGGARPAEAAQGERRLFFFVTGRFFPLFGVSPVIGRLFGVDADVRREPVVVLSHRYWQTVYRADPKALGQSLFLNGVPLTIVGVAPKDFRGVEHVVQPDFFVPAGVEDLITPGLNIRSCRACGSYLAVGRLAPGRSIDQLRAALIPLARQLATDYPELGDGYRFRAFTERQAHLDIAAAPLIGPVSAVFLALAGLVLLAACVNATNLVLTRASGRRTELTLRLALGASRHRVARQLLTENVVLGLVGLAGGYLVALGAAAWVNRVPMPADLPLVFGATIDGRVLGLTFGVALVTALLAGIAPAMFGSRDGVQQRLKEGARGSIGRGGDRFRAVLVVGQVAASLVVLVFAGLFGTSVRRAAAIDLGFEPERALKVQIDAGYARYDEPTARRAFDRLEQRARQMPGVEAVSWSAGVPLTGSPGFVTNLYPDDQSAISSRSGSIGGWVMGVGPEYFSVMGIRLLEGRGFRREDSTAGIEVAVVNEKAAELLWPGRSPIGRTVRLGPNERPLTVVGVVKTGRYVLVGESPKPFVYRPFSQAFATYAYLMVRTGADPGAVIPPLQTALREADQNLIPAKIETMRQVVNDGFNGLLLLRLGAIIAAAIGVMALVLTIVGLYGVIAYSVAQRTQEIGVRIALGASPSTVVTGILGQGVRLAGAGIAIGLGLATLVTRGAADLLVGVKALDLGVFVSVAGALVLISLGSAFIPARRAAKLDPVKALRE
jgi:predicted permease